MRSTTPLRCAARLTTDILHGYTRITPALVALNRCLVQRALPCAGLLFAVCSLLFDVRYCCLEVCSDQVLFTPPAVQTGDVTLERWRCSMPVALVAPVIHNLPVLRYVHRDTFLAVPAPVQHRSLHRSPGIGGFAHLTRVSWFSSLAAVAPRCSCCYLFE